MAEIVDLAERRRRRSRRQLITQDSEGSDERLHQVLDQVEAALDQLDREHDQWLVNEAKRKGGAT